MEQCAVIVDYQETKHLYTDVVIQENWGWILDVTYDPEKLRITLKGQFALLLKVINSWVYEIISLEK